MATKREASRPVVDLKKPQKGWFVQKVEGSRVHLACAGCGHKTTKAVGDFNGLPKGYGCRKCARVKRALPTNIITTSGFGSILTVAQVNELRPDMDKKTIRNLVRGGKTAEDIVAYKSRRGHRPERRNEWISR